MTFVTKTQQKRQVDPLLRDLADYVSTYETQDEGVLHTARACLADSIGCGLLALQYPECTKLLGPLIPGTEVPKGCPVPGTDYVLDPLCAAFNIGACIRWLDYNDTWLAAEWGHPSDNLGALLAVSDYLCRHGKKEQAVTVGDLLQAMVKAYEIQGGLALKNSLNRIGIDHVMFVKIASAAVSMGMLGGTPSQIEDVLSHAWIDNGSLRTYRHSPCTGSRKSWAAGDATARGLNFALMTLKGEMGYPQGLSAPQWGYQDVMFRGQPLELEHTMGSYVMDHILFKISYPAEFHSQTALEAAIQLHSQVVNRLDEIENIQIETHESAIRIISKKGPLHNPADRDHCLEYIIAIGMIYGTLNADHYEDSAAQDPRIDALREKMHVEEKKSYSVDYLDPDKRSIANALRVTFKDGTSTDRIEVEYPIGHKRRREEGLPILYEKFHRNLLQSFSEEKTEALFALWKDPSSLDRMLVSDLMDKLRKPSP